MFAKSKISQSMIDAVNSVITEEEKKRLINDDDPVKIATSSGTKVLGTRYGNSAKAHRDATADTLAAVKGPKDKELKALDKEPKRNLDEDGDCVTPPQAKDIAKKEVGKHEKGMHGKKGEVAKHVKSMHKENVFLKFAKELQENKSTGTEPTFTDNNMGEEMTDKQKSKREKIVMSMKKGEAGMKQRYGKNWKNVMYATATKQAMKEDSSDEWDGEELDEDDRSNAIEKQSKDNLTKSMKAMGKNNRQIKYFHKKTDDAIKKAAGEKVKEEVELDESSPAKKLVASVNEKKEDDVSNVKKDIASSRLELKMKNQDIADKAYLKHKPGTVKGQLTQIGRFLRGKPEIKESNDSHTHAAHYENDKGEWTGMNLFTAKDDDDAIKQAQAKCKEGCKLSKVERHTTVKEDVDVIQDKNGHKITTDMLSGRVEGGKLNSFKNFKVNLVNSGEETIPTEVDKGEDTKEKQKITTNPGPVDIKFDDKLGHPTVQSHFGTEHQITHESTEPPFDKPYKTVPKDVTDKSGAKHTPMSRARDLARQSFKKLKKETMMGKISN